MIEQYSEFDWSRLRGFQIMPLRNSSHICGEAERVNRQPGDIVSGRKSKLTFGRFVKGNLFKRKFHFLTLSLTI
jgi:hypothetical protein